MAPVLPRLNATEMEIKKAEKSYNRYVRSVADPMGLEAGLASDVIKQRWRKANSATVALWAALNEAAINAVENPGKAFKAGEHLTYKMAGNWLFCRLPSGRCLAYPSPRIRYEEVEFETDEGEIKVFKAKGVRYMGVNSITRKWSEMRLGSHTLAENCTQSVARDLMVEAALRLDAAGYDVALTVHDEVIAYADEGTGSVEDFCGIMAEVPAWATDCPIAAEGWVGKRYRK
jgi:DNA polymerase